MLKNILITTALYFITTTTHATVIAFDPAPLPGGSRIESSYSENGVSFTGSFAHTSSTLSGFASNDSSGYLSLLFGSSLRFEMSNSSLFSLGNIDLAEYSNVFIAPKTISFTGYYANGSSINQSFTTDGLFDSVGGIEDFETFSFASGFTNLAYVETNTNIFSMDNLEINMVPVPSTVYLFIAGLLGIIYRNKMPNKNFKRTRGNCRAASIKILARAI